MYEARWYREAMHQADLASFTVSCLEADLWIALNHTLCPKLISNCTQAVERLYQELSDYLQTDSIFKQTLTPHYPSKASPPIAQIMSQAAQKAGVGPMAAVAGAFAQEIGQYLMNNYPISDLIIENGGDIFLCTTQPRHIAIWAGRSTKLSNELALIIDPASAPLGICTSSGTVGHSLSFGLADAVTVLAKDTATANAYATALGNMVSSHLDIEQVLEYSTTQHDILGVVIIVDNHIGLCGNVKITKVHSLGLC